MSRYQLLPPLSDEEYAALRDDIRGAGVRVPIDVDEDGNILDGHHRKAIADELGKECPERIVRGLPEFAKVDYALTVNLTRRHLSREQRRELVTKSLKRDPRLSDREHARRCGVSHTYASGVREALEAADQLATVASRVGRDGRERQLPTTDPGLAGPAPDAEQASVASGTAAEGADIPPSAAPQTSPVSRGTEEAGRSSQGQVPASSTTDHPGSSIPGEGAGSAPAPAAGGTATTPPPAAPNSSRVDGFSGEETGEPAGTGSSDPEPVNPPAGEGEQGGPVPSPAGPPCEKCGGPIGEAEARAGYCRCGGCDEEGDHVDDGNGCRGCRVLAETDQAYVSLSVGETEFGLALECGECDGLVAHLAIGASVPSILAAAREHHRSCS